MISVKVQDSSKPVFSFPIFEEPLEMEIDVEESESPYIFTFPTLKNDFFQEEISFVIKKLSKNIELDQVERTLTIDFEDLDES
jgi:hypothetical protein